MRIEEEYVGECIERKNAAVASISNLTVVQGSEANGEQNDEKGKPSQAAIEAAFLVPAGLFEEIRKLHSQSTVQEPHTIILTIPVERRVASVVISIPRALATQFSHQFRLPTIFKSS
jgi:hypothetical protein